MSSRGTVREVVLATLPSNLLAVMALVPAVLSLLVLGPEIPSTGLIALKPVILVAEFLPLLSVVLLALCSLALVLIWWRKKGLPAWSYSWLGVFMAFVPGFGPMFVISVLWTYFTGARPDQMPRSLYTPIWLVFWFLPVITLTIWLFTRRGGLVTAFTIFSFLVASMYFYFLDHIFYPQGAFAAGALLALVWVTVTIVLMTAAPLMKSLGLILGTAAGLAIYNYTYLFRPPDCTLFFPGLSQPMSTALMAGPVIAFTLADIILSARKPLPSST